MCRTKNSNYTIESFNKSIEGTSKVFCVSDFQGMNKKAKMECKKCNKQWWAYPKNVTGMIHGCPDCSRIARDKKASKWNNDYLEEVNPHKHIKVLENFHSNERKVKFLCEKCKKTFNTRPGVMVSSKHGCPHCAREITSLQYHEGVPTILYYVFFPEYSVFKIGITTGTTADRYKYSGVQYEIIMEKQYDCGKKAFIEEQRIIYENKSDKYQGKDFLEGGITECFSKDVLGLMCS